MLRSCLRSPRVVYRFSRAWYSVQTLQKTDLNLMDVEALKTLHPVHPSCGNCLRDSTAAVASRLSQQTQFPLLPGTPFSLEGALNTNPYRHARIVSTRGPDAATLFCNQEWRQLMGYSLEELKGKSTIDALVSDWTDRSTVDRIKEAFCLGKRFRTTIVTARKDKVPVMMQLQITPLLSKNRDSSHILTVIQSSL